MADPIFAERRLAEIYDELDSDRGDLTAYLAIVDEFRTRSILDIGCGTGTFACLLANRGLTVVGVDPAAASLEVARTKPGADRVRWVYGYATDLPSLQVDLVTMTGNVAQVLYAVCPNWILCTGNSPGLELRLPALGGAAMFADGAFRRSRSSKSG